MSGYLSGIGTELEVLGTPKHPHPLCTKISNVLVMDDEDAKLSGSFAVAT
jgi:hypothetical protein